MNDTLIGVIIAMGGIGFLVLLTWAIDAGFKERNKGVIKNDRIIN